jgi:hypothetical protein
VVACALLAGVLRAPWLAPSGPEPAARLASVLAGAVSVAVVGLMAGRLAGPRGAAAAALLLALSPIHTLASREAAPGVVLVLLVALSFWLALEVDADTRPHRAIIHGLLVGALASASAAGLGLALLQLAWLAVRRGGRRATAISSGAAVAVIALAGGLGLLTSPLTEGAEVVWAPATTLLGMVRCAGASFTRVAGLEYQLVFSHARFLAPLTLVFIVVALLGARALPTRTRALFLGGMGVPFAAGALLALLTGRVTPLQAGRMIAALPPLVALMAVGLASLRGWRLAVTAGLLVGATTLSLTLALVAPPP